MLEDIRIQHKELIEDTKKAHKKNDKLLLKLDAAADNVRELSIQNAELRKDVQKYRDTSYLRIIGASGMAVIGAVSPFATPYFESNHTYYAAIYFSLGLSIAALVVGLLVNRKQPDNE
ncbi:MAG: hypothetical protein LBH00_07485 [Planctomycetaceae bacterium]|nr:hypothetical protein [Planctomycetaceae bacterium]